LQSASRMTTGKLANQLASTGRISRSAGFGSELDWALARLEEDLRSVTQQPVV
jgi:hypothetical protein